MLWQAEHKMLLNCALSGKSTGIFDRQNKTMMVNFILLVTFQTERGFLMKTPAASLNPHTEATLPHQGNPQSQTPVTHYSRPILHKAGKWQVVTLLDSPVNINPT